MREKTDHPLACNQGVESYQRRITLTAVSGRTTTIGGRQARDSARDCPRLRGPGMNTLEIIREQKHGALLGKGLRGGGGSPAVTRPRVTSCDPTLADIEQLCQDIEQVFCSLSEQECSI